METEAPKPFTGTKLELTKSLETIFNDELNSMFCSITHLGKNLPEMARLAAFTNLRLAFEETLEETLDQINRINKIFDHFEIKKSEKSCLGIKCIIEEAYTAVKISEAKSFKRDMALIFYAQIIEHIEIASYTILKTIATKIKYDEASILLNENLDEVKDTRKLLELLSKEYILTNH